MTRKTLVRVLMVGSIFGVAGSAMAAGLGGGVGVGASGGVSVGGGIGGVGMQSHAEAGPSGLERSTTRLQENVDKTNTHADKGLNTAIDAHVDAQARSDDRADKPAEAADKKARHAKKKLQGKSEAAASKAKDDVKAAGAEHGKVEIKGEGEVKH